MKEGGGREREREGGNHSRVVRWEEYEMRITSELLFSEGRWKVERAVKERKTRVNLTPQGPGWLKCGHEGVFTQHITCGILLQFETNRCGDSRDLLDFNFCLLAFFLILLNCGKCQQDWTNLILDIL